MTIAQQCPFPTQPPPESALCMSREDPSRPASTRASLLGKRFSNVLRHKSTQRVIVFVIEAASKSENTERFWTDLTVF